MISRSTSGASLKQQRTDTARQSIYLDPLIEIPVNAILGHLQKRSQPITLSGEEGIGKSTLLQVLYRKAPANFDVCLLRAKPKMSLAAIVATMRKRWCVGKESNEDGVAACVERMIAAGQRPVVIVDDAHELQPYVLDGLFRIKYNFDRRSQGVMGLVLSARPVINLELGRLATSNPAINQTVTLKVRPFNRQQTKRLLGERLPRGLEPLDDRAVDEIQRSSGGLPAQILRAADQLLDPGVRTSRAAGRHVPVLITLSVGFLAILAALMYF
ncbi:MAG: AAA family ATPase [Gammaproteobacteria bacterium]